MGSKWSHEKKSSKSAATHEKSQNKKSSTHNQTPQNTTEESPSTSSSPPQDNWLPNKGHFLPTNAVFAGYDLDGKTMYVSRVFHKGDYIPAKAFDLINWATFPYNGREIFVKRFEYLIGDKYKWVNGEPFPPGAVVVNPLSINEHLYVGRSNYRSSLVCGKFVPSKNCLYIPFGLKEVAVTGRFEILVNKEIYEREMSIQKLNCSPNKGKRNSYTLK